MESEREQVVGMATREYSEYLNSLRATFSDYLAGRFPPQALDQRRGGGLVFAKGYEHLNLFDPELSLLLPPERRHRWFRSLTSSQALALSVLGNVAKRAELEILSSLICDDSASLSDESGPFWFYAFEFTPWWLELGKRKTQIDLYLVSNTRRIAIECKLTEADIGTCDFVQKGRGHSAFSSLPGYEVCSRVRQNGAKYWIYWSQLSDLSFPQACPDRCPIYKTYQLARNVMAAAVNPADATVDGRGSALLLYDARNPAFKVEEGGPQIARDTRGLLKDPSLLRSANWQSLARLLDSAGGYEDLLAFMKDKYGIFPGISPSEETEDTTPTIYLDADPINADWIKVVHWERILSSTKGLDAFRSELRREGFTADGFRELHYFSLLAEKYPWLRDL